MNIKHLIIIGPIFLLAILGWGLTQVEKGPWASIGYIIIALQFVLIFGTMIIMKTPSTDEINRKLWKNSTIGYKIKWKLNKWFNLFKGLFN